MKRSSPLQRSRPLRTSGPTKAKKVARYASYIRSTTWKVIRQFALERSGYRCEHQQAVGPILSGAFGTTGTTVIRCSNTEYLTVHHLSYARFGGQEQPEDLQVLCKAHHAIVEARDFPHRHPRRRVA